MPITGYFFVSLRRTRILNNSLRMPKPSFSHAHGLRLTIETGQRELSAAFFPSDPDILDNPAPQKLTPIPNGLILDLKKDANLVSNPAQLKGF